MEQYVLNLLLDLAGTFGEGGKRTVFWPWIGTSVVLSGAVGSGGAVIWNLFRYLYSNGDPLFFLHPVSLCILTRVGLHLF